MASAEPTRRARGAQVLLGAGALLLVAAVAVLVVALVGGGEDPPAPERPTRALEQEALGVRLRYPVGWERRSAGRAIRLTSPDRTVGVSIAIAARRPAVRRVVPEVERSLRRAYPGARVLQRRDARVGNRPARATALRARNVRGEVVDVLALTTASRFRTYAVVTFGSPLATQAPLREAQRILRSIRFVRPRER